MTNDFKAFKTLSTFNFSTLSKEQLLHMQQGANEMIEILEKAANQNYHILTSVLASKEDTPFTQWQHYPPGDVQDTDQGALWFYHAHDEDETARPWMEHGHFHLFTYSEHVDQNVKPLALPENPDMKKGGLCHLVAISFNTDGLPVRIFTTNRWVSDEWMYDSGQVIQMLDKFQIEKESPYHLTSQWLCALIKLYRPQIEWALHERDKKLKQLEKAYKDQDKSYFEDEEIEVLSAITFDLAHQIDSIEEALESR